MIAYAAIDIRGGRVVQLVGGDPDHERINLPDPNALARRWVDDGFRALHVVDLDAALGTGNNRDAIEAILAAVDAPVQVGGGVRDDASAEALLGLGAAHVVAGTRAVEDPAWLAALAERHPQRIVVAADIRDDIVVTRGWTATTGLTVEALLERLDPIPLAGILVTDVAREGRLSGVNADRFQTIADATRHPVIAAGGIAGTEDLTALAESGVHGAVLGMALYTGAIDPRTIVKEFSA